MHAPMKYVEKGLAITANGMWQLRASQRLRRQPARA